MSVESHNKIRLERWGKKFNEDKSKVFLIVGKKEDGSYSFYTDISPNPFVVSQELQVISKAIHKKYK